MRRANALAEQTSPYLLQHAHNPVDWQPWGPAALEQARAQDKPIFLSIGYSACHWCHVMERESFEDDAIAAQLNSDFVCIKVDREERPDLDEIYMKAVQAMTGQGGWPMSVWLTPELEPFYGGTYFPPSRRYGRPGFSEILTSLSRAWSKDRAGLIAAGKRMSDHLRKESAAATRGELLPGVLDASAAMLEERFDGVWGGFGGAPKFPHALDLRILLRHHLRTHDPRWLQMVELTLDRMAEGGIHDQLGGGFHRYSTDERWLIPHFEKMLYDNALLVPAYLEAYCASGDAHHAAVARGACDWALREMRTAEGAFASAQDADSEGEEGRFFAWTPQEVIAVLGERLGGRVCEWFDVRAEGNFEHGRSALWRHEPGQAIAARLGVPLDALEREMQSAKQRLFEARSLRERPMTDDKVLVAWNGLMISALCHAAQVLDEAKYHAAARDAAECILNSMQRPDGSLFATSRGGRAHLNAYLDDYAFFAQGLIDLYETDFEPRWLDHAARLMRLAIERFEDPDQGGFFTTASDHETLIARLKSPHDGALPSGNGVMALALLRLAELTGESSFAEAAQRTILSVGQLVNRFPAAFSQMLLAVDFLQAGPREIVISGELEDPSTRALLKCVRRRFLPQRVVALATRGSDEARVPLLKGRLPTGGGARAFVCRHYACAAPVSEPAALDRALD